MARIAEALAVSWNTANDAVLAGTGPARLLDMVEGRSKAAFKGVAGATPQSVARWDEGGRDGRVHRVQDRRQRGTPTATTVMDPFHIARLA